MAEDETPNLFGFNNLQDLQSEDFALASTDGLVLYAYGCSVVLFYGDDEFSKGLQVIWLDLASRFADVNFFGVNMMERRAIAKRIGEIRNSPNHPLNWAATARTPYILVFREADDPQLSYPQAFYNGPLDVNSLSEWIVTLACQPGYTDRVSITMADVVAPLDTEDVIADVQSREPPVLTRQYGDKRRTIPSSATSPRPSAPPRTSSATPSRATSRAASSQTSRTTSRTPTTPPNSVAVEDMEAPPEEMPSSPQERLEALDESVDTMSNSQRSAGRQGGESVGYVKF
jgi:hypothetical protein